MADLNSDLLELITQLSPHTSTPDVDIFEAVKTPPEIPTEHVLPIFVHFDDSLEQTRSDIYMLLGLCNEISDPALKPRILRYLYHLHYHYAKLLKSARKLKDPKLIQLLVQHEQTYPKAKFFYYMNMLESAIEYDVTIDEFSQIFEPSIVAQYISLRKSRGLDVVVDLVPIEVTIPEEIVEIVLHEEFPTIENPVMCPAQFDNTMKECHTPVALNECTVQQWFRDAEAVNDYDECMYVVNPEGDQTVTFQKQSGLLICKTETLVYVVAPHDHRLNYFCPLPECAVMGSVIVYVARTARSTTVFSIT